MIAGKRECLSEWCAKMVFGLSRVGASDTDRPKVTNSNGNRHASSHSIVTLASPTLSLTHTHTFSHLPIRGGEWPSSQPSPAQPTASAHRAAHARSFMQLEPKIKMAKCRSAPAPRVCLSFCSFLVLFFSSSTSAWVGCAFDST